MTHSDDRVGESVASIIERYMAVSEVEKRDGDLVRRVRIGPEFDCHDRCAFDKPTCKKGSGGYHGIGSRRVIWSVAVIGRGAVALDMSTPIYTENALLRGGPRLAALRADWHPLGPLDLHYGTPPDYLAEYGSRECNLIDAPCWGDVTYMQSDNGHAAFMLGGNEAVWSWLAETWLPDVVQSGSRAASGSET